MANNIAIPTDEELKKNFASEDETPENYAILRRLAENKNYDASEMAQACIPFIKERIIELTDDFFYQEINNDEIIHLENDEDYPEGKFLTIQSKDLDDDLRDILLPHAMIDIIAPMQGEPLKWSQIVENYKQNKDKLAIILTDYILNLVIEDFEETVDLFKNGLTDKQIFELYNTNEFLELEEETETTTNSPKPSM